MKRIYRKRGQPTKLVSFRLSAKTLAGLQAIRDAFQSKYPADQYATLTMALESAIQSNLKRLNNHPAQLAAEVADFERRYPRPVGQLIRHSPAKPTTGDGPRGLLVVHSTKPAPKVAKVESGWAKLKGQSR